MIAGMKSWLANYQVIAKTIRAGRWKAWPGHSSRGPWVATLSLKSRIGSEFKMLYESIWLKNTKELFEHGTGWETGGRQLLEDSEIIRDELLAMSYSRWVTFYQNFYR